MIQKNYSYDFFSIALVAQWVLRERLFSTNYELIRMYELRIHNVSIAGLGKKEKACWLARPLK